LLFASKKALSASSAFVVDRDDDHYLLPSTSSDS
jgi:hypothetical protein